MKLKDKIFDVFFSDEDELTSEEEHITVEKDLYSNEDPFDFYRKPANKSMYTPLTQRALRKAFSEGFIAIEFFLVKATSLRPLEDEAQDLDEITRMFSQQKLASRPTPHSVRVLRNMIKDPDPEIALYAAEGLNSIENIFIDKISSLKEDIEKSSTPSFNLFFELGKTYLNFSRLLSAQKLIQQFYVKEALSNFGKALKIKPKNLEVLKKLGEANLILGLYESANYTFDIILSHRKSDVDILFNLAECYYYTKDYDRLREATTRLSKLYEKINPEREMVVYQWILSK